VTGVRAIDLDPTRDSPRSDSPSSAGGGAQKAPAPTRVSPGTQEFVDLVRVVYTVAPAA
jgi:hypothetical protein